MIVKRRLGIWTVVISLIFFPSKSSAYLAPEYGMGLFGLLVGSPLSFYMSYRASNDPPAVEESQCSIESNGSGLNATDHSVFNSSLTQSDSGTKKSSENIHFANFLQEFDGYKRGDAFIYSVKRNNGSDQDLKCIDRKTFQAILKENVSEKSQEKAFYNQSKALVVYKPNINLVRSENALTVSHQTPAGLFQSEPRLANGEFYSQVTQPTKETALVITSKSGQQDHNVQIFNPDRHSVLPKILDYSTTQRTEAQEASKQNTALAVYRPDINLIRSKHDLTVNHQTTKESAPSGLRLESGEFYSQVTQPTNERALIVTSKTGQQSHNVQTFNSDRLSVLPKVLDYASFQRTEAQEAPKQNTALAVYRPDINLVHSENHSTANHEASKESVQIGPRLESGEFYSQVTQPTSETALIVISKTGQQGHNVQTFNSDRHPVLPKAFNYALVQRTEAQEGTKQNTALAVYRPDINLVHSENHSTANHEAPMESVQIGPRLANGEFYSQAVRDSLNDSPIGEELKIIVDTSQVNAQESLSEAGSEEIIESMSDVEPQESGSQNDLTSDLLEDNPAIMETLINTNPETLNPADMVVDFGLNKSNANAIFSSFIHLRKQMQSAHKQKWFGYGDFAIDNLKELELLSDRSNNRHLSNDATATHRWHSFVQLYSDQGRGEVSGLTNSYQYSSFGLNAGVFNELDDVWITGFLFNTQKLSMSVKQGKGSGESESYRVGPFVSAAYNNWQWNLALLFGWNNYQKKYHHNGQRLTSQYSGRDWSLFSSLDYRISLDQWHQGLSITPRVEIMLLQTKHPEHTAKNHATRRTINKQASSHQMTRMGVELDYLKPDYNKSYNWRVAVGIQSSQHNQSGINYQIHGMKTTARIKPSDSSEKGMFFDIGYICYYRENKAFSLQYGVSQSSKSLNNSIQIAYNMTF